MSAQSIALTVLAQNYGGDIVRQINRTTSTLRLIPITVGEGKNVAWVAEEAGATAQPMAEGAGGTSTSSDVQAAATLNWAYYDQTFEVTGPAQAASRTSRTPEGNLNLIGRQLTNSLAVLASKINGHLYSGNGAASPKEVTGFDAAIGDTTNTYATLDRTSKTYWQPYVINPATATGLSLGQIREDLKEIFVKSGEHPDIAVCHPSVYNEVGNLFDSQRRLIQTVDKVMTARGTITLSGGYTGIEVDGCVFVKDKDATLESGNASGRIYYMNTNYVELQVQVQPEFAAAMPGFNVEPEMMLQANDGFGEVPLLAAVVKLAKIGDASRFMSKAYVELRVKKPRSCGVRRFVKLNFAG